MIKLPTEVNQVSDVYTRNDQCINRHLRPFCCCDLDIDPMTFIYELHTYSVEINRMCKYNFLWEGFRKLSSDRHTLNIHTEIQTDRQMHRNYIPRRYAGGQNLDFTALLCCSLHLQSTVHTPHSTSWLEDKDFILSSNHALAWYRYFSLLSPTWELVVPIQV